MTTLDDLAKVERELRESFPDFAREEFAGYGRNAIHGWADTIAAYIAAQREREAVNGWQPMETAPKGLPILTLMKHGAIEGEWDGETAGGYYWRDMEWYPTHWMPLPAPPQEPTP